MTATKTIPAVFLTMILQLIEQLVSVQCDLSNETNNCVYLAIALLAI